MPYDLKHVFASLPQMERGQSKVISGDPKGNNFLYTNGKCVIIRNIENPQIADVYTEHVHPVQVAKYAPSGFYIASGDSTGKVRIWDTTQKEHILKFEYQPLSGKVMDISWTEDSKRLAVVGDGREKFASVFLWDTGSSVGELTGHSKHINSVDIRQKRPYRIATASDDTTAGFFEGPPFKFKFTIREHNQFINCVRFSPDGTHFATAGADGQIFLYDGTKGELVRALGGEKAHSGGIYSISWSPDSSQLISASGDRTVKLWDVGSGSAVTTFSMGSGVNDQQLGCLWQNDHLLSVSLSGNINYLDKNQPTKPLRVIKGHTKSIHCLTVHKGDGRSYIYSGSSDGNITRWDSDLGLTECFSGKGHTNQVSSMCVNESEELVTCSMDDTVRFTATGGQEYSGDVVKMDSQPKSVSASGALTLAVCIGQIVLLKDKRKVFSSDSLDFEPEVGALQPGGAVAAVGDAEGKIHLYSVHGSSLAPEGPLLEARGKLTALGFSPDGAFLAALDDQKVLTVFTVADNYSVKGHFYGHHAKPVTLCWSPDSEHIATGGMDMNVIVWDVNDEDKRIKMPDCHRLHHVSGLAWIDAHTLVTTSHDSTVKQWTLTY
uniref:WD repeat domain 1 n=1 Tax=Knipowitschia caucasica TaxID=637954 RepID=A0AAV2M5E1_KNICA